MRVFEHFKSPVLPLALFANSSLIFFAVLFFLGVSHSSYITGGYYLALVFWALSLFIKSGRYIHLRFTVNDFFFLSFVLIVITSLFLHKSSADGILVTKFVVFVIFSYSLGRFCRLDDVMPVILIIFLTSLIGIFLAIIDSFLHPESVFSWARPFFFELNHTTIISGILIGELIVLLIIYLIHNNKGRIHWMNILIYGVNFILVLLLTFLKCRGVLLVTLITSILASICFGSSSWLRRMFIASSLIVSLIVALSILPQAQSFLYYGLKTVCSPQDTAKHINRKVTESQNSVCSPQDTANHINRKITESQNSVEIRKFLLQHAYKLYVKHPKVGAGAGNFGLYYDNQNIHPHNTTIQVLSELGSSGGVFFIAFIFFIFIRLSILSRQHRMRKKDSLIISSIFVLWFMHLLLDHIYGDYFSNIAFMLYSGIAVAAIDCFKDRKFKHENVSHDIGDYAEL